MNNRKSRSLLKKIGTVIFSATMFLSLATSVLADDAQDNFLKDLADGLTARWSHDADENAMSNSEFMEYRTQIVNEEYDLLSRYKDADFESEKFALMAQAYIEALEMQLDAVKYYTELSDVYDTEWSAGYGMRALLIPDFVDHYGLDVPEEEVTAFREYSGKTISTGANTSDQTSTENTVEDDSEIELYNNQGIKVVITGMKEPDYTSTDFYVRIENLNHHNIIVHTSNSQMVVNGTMVSSPLYAEVQSGKTANVTMTFWKDTLDAAGIDKIREMSMDIEIADTDSYNTLYKGDEKYLSVSDDNQISEKVVYTDKENIQKVQELLNSAGYDCGSADGVPGEKTNNALLQFEKDHDLPETTDITPELIESLEAAIE